LNEADIILLQEMDTDGAEKIAQRLNYNYIYYPATIHRRHNRDFGNSILSKWPISKEMKLILPHEHPINRQKRIAAVATIELAGYEVLTYSVHTETTLLPHQKRMDQVEWIAGSIPADRQHVIVGGDFNTAFSRCILETDRLMGDAGLKRASSFTRPTARIAPLGLLRFQLDHVFTRGWHVIDSGVVRVPYASDHFPVWVVLQPELTIEAVPAEQAQTDADWQS
jgi:endonuclease/exonuclease/phosphatase (EEP) superfamily protein YafD